VQEVKEKKTEKAKEKAAEKSPKKPKVTKKQESKVVAKKSTTTAGKGKEPEKEIVHALKKGNSFLKLVNVENDPVTINLTRGLSISDFYTPYAGLNSEIQTESRDQYNNPNGREFDLGVEGAFGRFGILIGLFFHRKEISDNIGTALREKGFRVEFARTEKEFSEKLDINQYDQGWIISHKEVKPQEEKNFVATCRTFHENGGGLAIWADNTPFVKSANLILQDLFQTTMEGNTPGRKVLTLGDSTKNGFFGKHLLTSGIENLFEGNTICFPQNSSPKLHVLATSSDGHPCMLFADYPQLADTVGRVAVDCGLTKMYKEWDSAGTARYVRNMAVWLLGLEHRLKIGAPIQGKLVVTQETPSTPPI